MSFFEITKDLQDNLHSNLPQIRFLLKKNPALAFSRMNEIGSDVGKKYKIKLILNFPKVGKIENFEMYGKQDLSIIVDQTKTRFPINRETIKEKARLLFSDCRTEDAYMYEGKEGAKIFFKNGRIDILPHSLHIWCKFSDKVTEYCDWLLKEVYLLNNTKQA